MFSSIQGALSPVLTAIGAFLVAGGGFAAIAYAIFRFFSEKWLTAKFEERLAAYKHAQQKELEHLRLEINSLLDRNVKLHQREFDTLPQAWSLFNDAFWLIRDIWGLRTYPDLNSLPSDKLEEFLKEKSLTESQKKEIRGAADKTQTYIGFAEWDEIRDALKSYSEWKRFYLKNAIFMTESIKVTFSELDELIKGALVEHKMRVENRGARMREMKDFEKLLSEGQKLRDVLEAEIHKRLWISAALPDAQ